MARNCVQRNALQGSMDLPYNMFVLVACFVDSNSSNLTVLSFLSPLFISRSLSLYMQLCVCVCFIYCLPFWQSPHPSTRMGGRERERERSFPSSWVTEGIDAIEMCESCSSISKQFNCAKLISQKRKLCYIYIYIDLYIYIYTYMRCMCCALGNIL